MTSAGSKLIEQPVVFGLGANLGHPEDTIEAALDELHRHPQIQLAAVSSWYRTAPVGLVDQPDFINVIALGATTLNPDELWTVVSELELRHGRERLIPGGPRTLDVDVISYGQQVATTASLTLPHPRAHQRAFVLLPWAEVDPTATLPGKGAIDVLIAGVDGSGVERLDRRPKVGTR